VTDSEVTNDLNDAYSRMKSLGTVYPVTGNHDSCPVNSFPPADVSTTISPQFAYDAMSSDWQPWIGSSAASEVSSNFGSYSVVHPGGLKVISVNTNFWYKQNFWMYEAAIEPDPSGMFAWLVAELQEAEAAGQRVWILGHMPMGASDAFHDASYYFGELAILLYTLSRAR
jgi:sphingomyelin phosphodiesterase